MKCERKGPDLKEGLGSNKKIQKKETSKYRTLVRRAVVGMD